MIGFLLASLAWSASNIVIEGEPTTHETVAIDVIDDLSRPVSGATVRAIRRPGLPGERDLAVGLTDARGRVYWTPKRPGTQILRAREHELIVHVRPDTPSPTPIVLLSSSGLVGLGLLVWGLWPRRRR